MKFWQIYDEIALNYLFPNSFKIRHRKLTRLNLNESLAIFIIHHGYIVVRTNSDIKHLLDTLSPQYQYQKHTFF